MRRTAVLSCVIVLLLQITAGASPTHLRKANPTFDFRPPGSSRQNTLYWFDDIESGENGWTHRDLTADVEPRFHVDTYLALPDGSFSYWCGVIDPAFAGGDGYGNAWDQRLELPPVHLGGTPVEEMSWGQLKSMFRTEDETEDGRDGRYPGLPMLTFAYRHDSELNCDFTRVQADSLGTWVDLNDGYTGSSGGWQEVGDAGLSLAGFGDPVRVRFRFLSDGAWSDEDGLYVSDGGAFHVDDIRVYDFATGEVYFYDDCEDGFGLCEATIPPAAGDWWHIIDRSCPAISDPHSWWCGDDADTGLIPPGLHNELSTPIVDISIAQTCTANFAIHFAVPAVDNDYVEFRGTSDGENYYGITSCWGDFAQCDGWDRTSWVVGYNIGQFSVPPFEGGGLKFIFHTTDNGCGPAAAGDAGVMIDNVYLAGDTFHQEIRNLWRTD
ncbi:MAG TPA: hypothetical protein VE960_05830 [bacterium]|nr:hypothetical protein [bacterium]